MTIRSTVKKTDRYGIQGSVSFDPKHPNANVALYRELERFLGGDQGLGGSGGVLANKVKDARSYQASHVFNTPSERDAVAERLQKQYQEQFIPKIGDIAKAAGKSPDEYLRSQGITPPQYSPDDFIMASQNPLRGSTEKKIKAYMTMAGNTQYISGGTGEHRRHTGYYRPNELKHVRSMLSTDARKLNEGTGNLGELEGLYLPASQKLEARGAQNIFKNGLTEDMLTNEKHPVVAKIRGEMLKQHAMTQLKAKVKKGLQDEELLPPDEEPEEKKKGKSIGTKAMEATSVVTGKILSVAGDLKTLFTAAVNYLQNIASEIGALKQASASLGIPMEKALVLKHMGSLNTVSGGNDNTYLEAASAWLGVTSSPAKLSNIKWDESVLQGQAGLIKPIIDAAVSGKIKPVDTMFKIYNQLGAQYFNPKLSTEGRMQLRAKQMAALESIAGTGAANAYQVATDTADMYGLAEGKNRYNMMGRIESHTANDNNKAMINEVFGMTNETALGSKENQKALNDFNRTVKLFEEAIKKFTMVHIDDVVRAMVGLTTALLEFIAFFQGKDGSAAKLLKGINIASEIEGQKQRAKLGENSALVRTVLMGKLAEADYKDANAENILTEILHAKDTKAISKVFTNRPDIKQYHGEDLLRDLIILADVYKELQISKWDYDTNPEKGLVDSGNLKNELESNLLRNPVLNSLNLQGVNQNDYKRFFKKGIKIKPEDIKAADEDMNKATGGQLKKELDAAAKAKEDAFLQLNLNSIMKHTLPSRALEGAGSLLDKRMQGAQNIAVDNTVRVIIKDREYVVKNDAATNDKMNRYFTEIRTV